MAYVHTLVNRGCPGTSFETIEQAVADTVGLVVYGGEYPDPAGVDVAVGYAKLGTYMALKVEVDTEDLPGAGWFMTKSGLCVKSPDRITAAGAVVPETGLTEDQRNAHFMVQAKVIHDRLAEHEIWQSGVIGWSSEMDSTKMLGVLVARAEGAWFASYTQPKA